MAGRALGSLMDYFQFHRKQQIIAEVHDLTAPGAATFLILFGTGKPVGNGCGLFEFLRNDKFDAEDYFLNFGLAPGAARNAALEQLVGDGYPVRPEDGPGSAALS